MRTKLFLCAFIFYHVVHAEHIAVHLQIISMEWGLEGFDLWMVAEKAEDTYETELLTLSMAKSASLVNIEV